MCNKMNLYDKRLKRLMTTVKHKEPDFVPILGLFETWAIHYGNCKVQDVINNPQKELDCYGKVYKNIYFDIGMSSCLSSETDIYTTLGGGAYFYSEDNITIQHKEYVFMTEDDYPSFIKDPINYTVNENFLRKYPALNKPYPENLNSLKKSFRFFIKKAMKAQNSIKYMKENLDMPIIKTMPAIAPVDLIMDYYRGFKGVMIDIRRRPQELLEAAEASIPIIMAHITKGQTSLSSFPFVFFPLHIPTFLSPKQFEKIYWPSFKKVLNNIYNLGGNVLLYTEGNWEHLYEFINELPKDFVTVLLEKDDIFKAKDKIGNNVTIAGGLPLNMLRYSSKDECIEHSKRVIDKCAPGGGFIFTTDKMALAPGDYNAEKLIAVNEFVHNYGKY